MTDAVSELGSDGEELLAAAGLPPNTSVWETVRPAFRSAEVRLSISKINKG